MEQNEREQDLTLIEEPVSSEEIYHGKVVHLFKDTVRLPNGKNATREVMRHIGAAAVVALTENDEVILVRQYRHPFGTTLLEIPAGKLDPGEAPERCARRELQEETGFSTDQMISLGVYYPSVAILDEKIHLYLAKRLTRSEAHLDDDEFLHVETMPLDELVGQILAGKIPDGKTQVAILKAWYLLKGDVDKK